MHGPEFIVAIVGIICGTALVGYTLGKIFGLIKAWINRNDRGYDEDTFNRLAKAFTQHKKDTERRLQNLEAIVTDEPPPSPDKTLDQPNETIAIETNTEQQKSGAGKSNLRNMLRE